MKDQHILEVIAQVFAFVGPQYPQREADQCPHVNNGIVTAIVFTELMDLGVAVVTAGDTVIGTGGLDLLILEFTEFQALFLETGLEEAAAAAATIVVGAVGLHVDEIFFTHHRFHYIAQIFRDGIAEGFSNDLAGILDGELDFKVFVPVRIDLQFALPDPFGVILVDVFNDKIVLKVELFQSCQD